MRNYYHSNNGQQYKGDNTIVTLADTEINDYLIKRVKEQFPSHSVDGEENGFGKSDHLWVCDPVDGTAMYARHIPVACFSLALCIDGKPIVGVVNDVFSNNLYTAIKGEGAFRNGEKIFVNEIGLDDKRSMAAYDTWTREYDLVNTFLELRKRTYFIHFGTFIRDSICVASGEIEFAIYPAAKHRNCDIAALKVIVEEAGGIVTDLYGNEQRYDCDIKGAIVSNRVVYEDVLNAVKKDLKV